MINAKTKKIALFVGAIFGLVVLVAAIMRGKKTSDASNGQISLVNAVKDEIVTVTKTN